TDGRPDDLVHAQRVGPEGLVAEGVEPEDRRAVGEGARAVPAIPAAPIVRGETDVAGQRRHGSRRVIVGAGGERTGDGEDERDATHHSPRNGSTCEARTATSAYGC